MKKTITFFVVLLCCNWGYGQSLSPEVTASGGDHFTGADVQLSWTIGELMIDHYDDGVNILTQGFHQSNLLITAVETSTEGIGILTYPNPVTDNLTIDCLDVKESLTLILYDQKGTRLLIEKGFNQNVARKTTLDLSNFPSNIFLLQVIDEQGKTVKTFKILKNK